MGDTPICVILDGDTFPAELRRYGVTVVRRNEVEPRELREASFGSLRAKNTALWASPFETFLLLDADTIVWGDMRQLADFDRYDFIVDQPGVEPLYSVMDVEQAVRCFPDFDARRHIGRYVNSGVYFGRRGILDLDRYLHALRVARERPRLFFGSQGSFNYLLFGAVDEGVVRLGQRELQVQVGRTERAVIARRFGFEGAAPVVNGDPVVLHWVVSPKPRVRGGRNDYFEPMTHFRREFRMEARRGRRPVLGDTLRLRLEDMACTDRRGTNLRGRMARLRHRSRCHTARLKVAVRCRTPDSVVAQVRRLTT
jgi:hypothetical protein